MAEVAEPLVERYNADYLGELLEFLGTADVHEAIEAYEEAYQSPMGDDWLLAELGKQDLFFLLSQLLRRPDVGHPWLYERVREVEASPDDHLDLWAREHYKSTIITFGLTIQDILRDPELTVGIFSHTRPIAKGFLRQIKQEFEGNDDLKALYPDILWQNPAKEAPKWSEDEGIVVKRQTNPKESTVEAWGVVEGQPTSKHFRLLMYDDVVTLESVGSPLMMAKTMSSLETSFNLGADGGGRRWAGTRYHFNDAYREVMARKIAAPRIHVATENGETNGPPVLLTREALTKKRRDMGVYTFGCQMMQNPKQDSTQGFKREWLNHYVSIQGGRGLNKYLLVDPASKKKEHADYTYMWVLGLGPDENFYALEMIRDRLNLTERATRVIELHKKWKPLEVRYEEYGLQADIEHIEFQMELVQYRFKIISVGGRVAKPDRIRRLVPTFENGKFWLPASHNITTAEGETRDMVHDFIEEEYMPFPVAVYDDGLDSLSRIHEKEGHIGFGKTRQKVKLRLKWPAKLAAMPKFVAHEPLDRGMGM